MAFKKTYIKCIYLIFTILLLSLVAVCIFDVSRIVRIALSLSVLFVGASILIVKLWESVSSTFKGLLVKVKASILECTYKRLSVYTRRLQNALRQKDIIELLSPSLLKESRYVEILKTVIDDPKVWNVAISGSYGSGKSTVISTFEHLYPQYKCLNLSLAVFAEEYDGAEKDKSKIEGQDNKDSGDEQSRVVIEKVSMPELEYSLVQQFFYHVKASDIPDSRFGRIRRWSRFHKCLWVLALFVFGLAILICAKCSIVLDNITILFAEDFPYMEISYALVTIGTLCSLYYIVGLFHKMSSAHIKVMDYEVELAKDVKMSVFNRYLDELVYLFQTTGYNIVVLEDLDRFKNTRIFTKLRELNQLLNQAKDIKRRIVFVYALRDDIFNDSKERTKFFDYILPIIPYVNVSNSAANFVERFEPYIGNEDHDLHKSFISDIAPYVSDLRSIKAIVADFRLSTHYLDPKLKKDNLLAITVYKNLYPKEFEKLHEGSGPIKDMFDKKGEFISVLRADLIKEKDKIAGEILKTENEKLESVSELKKLVIGALASCVPENCILLNSENSVIGFSSLSSDEGIISILNGKIKYRKADYYSTIKNITADFVKSHLPDGFDYEARKRIVERKSDGTLAKLRRKLDSVQQQIFETDSYTMATLCDKLPEDLKRTLEPYKSKGLLLFLISRGYIDEQYYYYVTVFKPGILSVGDNEYVMAIKNFGSNDEDEFARPLDSPTAVLSFLQCPDFKSNKVLNFSLVHEIMTRGTEDQKGWIITKITDGSTESLDFLNRYEYEDDGLFKDVASYYDELWVDFCADKFFSNESKLILFERIVKYADVSSIKQLNADGAFAEYLEKNGYATSFAEISKDKALQIINTISPKFTSLYDDSESVNLFKYVYENNYYALNLHNVSLIISSYSQIKLSDFEGAIYSAVIASGLDGLKNRVSENLEDFVSKLVLANNNNKEQEASYICLLNDTSLTQDVKQQLIEHIVTRIAAIEKIDDDEIRNIMYEKNRVIASFENVLYYIGKELLDDRIAKFVLSNAEVFSDELVELKEPDEDDMNLVDKLLRDNRTTQLIQSTILSCDQFNSLWNSDPWSLSDWQIMWLIDNKRIKFSVSLFKDFGTNHETLYLRLLEGYAKDVIENISEFEFTPEYIILLSKSSEFEKDKNILFATISADDILSDNVADSFLEFSLYKDSSYKFEVLSKALMVSNNESLKLKSLTEYLSRGFTPDNWNTFFSMLGEKYEGLNAIGEMYNIDSSPEAYEFMNALNSRGIVGKVKRIDNSYRAHVKKR